MPVERSAGIVIYRDTPKGRRYLLLRAARDESTLASGKTVKDFWDFPKGKLEKGETGLEAARREAKEEAGLTDIEIKPEFKHTVQYFTFRTGKSVPKYVAMFFGRVGSRAITLSWEHDKYEWLSYEEAYARITIPKMKEALEAAEKFLKKIRLEAVISSLIWLLLPLFLRILSDAYLLFRKESFGQVGFLFLRGPL